MRAENIARSLSRRVASPAILIREIIEDVVEFSPVDIGSLRLLLDPTDASTLFTDVAGTVSVSSSGQLVAAMRDK